MKKPANSSLSAWIAVCGATLVLSFGCSKADTSQPQPQAQQAAPATTPPAAPTAAETPEPPAEPQAVPKTPAPAPASAVPSPAVAVPPKEPPAAKPPVVEVPAPAATPTASPAPTPPLAVAPHEPPAPPAAPAHAAVGSEKCKMCHRVQYDSWAASKHASANPPAACETCHGNGADYTKMSVMKDSAMAKAAGLVMPGKEFCTAKCHKAAAFTDDMLQKAHAHKAK